MKKRSTRSKRWTTLGLLLSTLALTLSMTQRANPVAADGGDGSDPAIQSPEPETDHDMVVQRQNPDPDMVMILTNPDPHMVVTPPWPPATTDE